MNSPIHTPFDWSSFVDKNWQKEPVVFHHEQLATPEEIFKTLLVSSDLYRQRSPQAPFFKLYVNGGQIVNNVQDHLPNRTDASPAAYEARLVRELSAESFTLFMTGFEAFNTDLYDRASMFLRGLFEKVGIPAGHAELELFLGRYNFTPGGIHNEACTNFQWVIDGDKTMHIWPEDSWSLDNLPVHVQRDPTSQAHEHYLSGSHDRDGRDSSVKLRGAAGDLLYWPSRAWHVGDSPTLSMAITAAIYMDGRPSDIVTNAMQSLLDERLGPAGQASSYSLPKGGGGGALRDLGANLSDSVNALGDLVRQPGLRQRIAAQWLRRVTSMSFSKVPDRHPTQPLASTEILRTDPARPIVWMDIGKGQLLVASNGYVHSTTATPTVIKMLERLNTAVPIRVGDLLALGRKGATDEDTTTLRAILQELDSMRAFGRSQTNRYGTSSPSVSGSAP